MAPRDKDKPVPFFVRIPVFFLDLIPILILITVVDSLVGLPGQPSVGAWPEHAGQTVETAQATSPLLMALHFAIILAYFSAEGLFGYSLAMLLTRLRVATPDGHRATPRLLKTRFFIKYSPLFLFLGAAVLDLDSLMYLGLAILALLFLGMFLGAGKNGAPLMDIITKTSVYFSDGLK